MPHGLSSHTTWTLNWGWAGLSCRTPREANNSQVSEAAFLVSKVEGRNTFSFPASWLDL